MANKFLEKTKDIEKRYAELSDQLSDPSVIADQNKWRELMREHSQVTPIIECIERLRNAVAEAEEAEELINADDDPDITELALLQRDEARETIEKEEQLMQRLLLPKDPNDEKNVIVEIRAGVGGEEAALFGSNLLRMYMRYAERVGWKSEIMSLQDTEMGGIKEAVLQISGKGAYSMLKFESGIHRVQRVPETESAGRIHTSAATVAVLPEAEDVEIEINPSDIRVDTYRSSGAGGQHVNKTESAIRITHIPTGIVVACQNERSQIQNRETAFKMLRSRLYDYYATIKNDEYTNNRRSQVGSGDRSERIRTYNFPQSRVTDHRINLTMYQLEMFMDGDIQSMIDALVLADETKRIAESLGGE